jgi:DNA-binding response OmpR family regulator
MALKVAIIEDDIAITQMYRMKFQSEGYEVETAGDGESGLALIQRFQPDIVLLDLMMPRMSGDAMLSRLRKTAWGKKIKVIILTNLGETEAPASVKRNGVQRFIVKADMTPRDVAEVVKAELGSK